MKGAPFNSKILGLWTILGLLWKSGSCYKNETREEEWLHRVARSMVDTGSPGLAVRYGCALDRGGCTDGHRSRRAEAAGGARNLTAIFPQPHS